MARRRQTKRLLRAVCLATLAGAILALGPLAFHGPALADVGPGAPAADEARGANGDGAGPDAPRAFILERMSRRERERVVPAPPAPGSPLARAIVVPSMLDSRFARHEVLVQYQPGTPPAAIAASAQAARLIELQRHQSALLGGTLFRYRTAQGQSVRAAIRALGRDPAVALAQPNFHYHLMQARTAPGGGAGAQYALDSLNLRGAHRVTTGRSVRVAVIDSGIDIRHPDLAGNVAAHFDAVGDGGQWRAEPHGTGMAGVIASRGRVTGVAPGARLLAVRAFTGDGARSPGFGTAFNIVRGLDWAHGNGARVVNMSFAGPVDAVLGRSLQGAVGRGMIAVAAAGNTGRAAPPLYPAAYPFVIAVTAVDAHGRVYVRASGGPHIEFAAPGVDVLTTAPGSYQVISGTSVGAAHISGLVALLLDRNRGLGLQGVRSALRASAGGAIGAAAVPDAERALGGSGAAAARQ